MGQHHCENDRHEGVLVQVIPAVVHAASMRWQKHHCLLALFILTSSSCALSISENKYSNTRGANPLCRQGKEAKGSMSSRQCQ